MNKASTFEKLHFKKLCGLPNEIDESLLPAWYGRIHQKNQDAKDNDMIVAETLGGPTRFDYVEMQIYPELKKSILKRNWTGGEAGGIPRYPYACYGITPFAMLDLNDDQVASMEMQHTTLAESSIITPSDIRATKVKLVATVPASGAKWREVILKFTNLLFLIFKGEYPLYTKMLEISKVLNKYRLEVLDGLDIHPKASILWIIHKQARHFAQGKMTESDAPSSCLPEFSFMYNLILSQQIHMVSFAGLPLALTAQANNKRGADDLGSASLGGAGKKRIKENETPGGDGDKTSTKPKAKWNPKIKDALEGPLRIAGYPGLRSIASYCGLLRDDEIISNVPDTECRNYMMFGRCRWGNACNRKHVTATDAQASEVIKKFEKFIQAPEELKGKKS